MRAGEPRCGAGPRGLAFGALPAGRTVRRSGYAGRCPARAPARRARRRDRSTRPETGGGEKGPRACSIVCAGSGLARGGAAFRRFGAEATFVQELRLTMGSERIDELSDVPFDDAIELVER